MSANSQHDDSSMHGQSRIGQIPKPRVTYESGSDEIASELANNVEISPVDEDVEISDANTGGTKVGYENGYESQDLNSISTDDRQDRANSLRPDSKRSRTRPDAYMAIPRISKIWVPGCTVYENSNSLTSESA